MPMKLYAHPENYKTLKALIAAKYVGLEIDTPKGPAAQTGRIPVLETDQGCIFSSTAIARYISRINRPVGLYGQNLIEGGMIDSWIEFCTHELEVPLCTWVLPVLGVFPEVPEATACAKEDVKKALNVLNNHLLHNTYMVGHGITLADISVACALLDGFKLVMDEAFRKPYANVTRWFELCLAQPEFKAVLGDVALLGGAKGGKAPAAKQEAKPTDQGKKEAAPKAEPKAKAEAKAKAEPKKEGKKEEKAAPKKEGKDKKEEKKPDGPATPEDAEKAKKAKLKAVIKEGGKRGVEIEGAADMGGLQFFCTSVAEPEGDLDLLVESMKAMNAKSDPAEEERKGGSGHIGKMIFSAGIEQLAVVAYVPEEKQGELSGEEWLKTVLGMFGGKVVKGAKDISTGVVLANSDKGVFPLKIREPMILEANNFLRKKGLFPEDDGDDDEMVFGDDDFPAADDEEPAPAPPPPPAPKKEEKPKEEPKKKEEGGKKDKKGGGGDKKGKDEPAEKTPEELEKERKAKAKAVIKEGGKRGVEIEGAADMGGLQFFCTSVTEPEGDLDLTVESMKAMNAKSDPTEEERKGGSGHIGKMIFSAGVEQLAVVAYVPEEKKDALDASDWLAVVLASQGGEVVTKGKDLATGVVKANADKGVFPLKIREPMILEANNFLRKKGLFPEDNGSDDDEIVYGDDDFPS